MIFQGKNLIAGGAIINDIQLSEQSTYSSQRIEQRVQELLRNGTGFVKLSSYAELEALRPNEIGFSKIYLVPNEAQTGYDQYMRSENSWQNIGSTSVSIDGYATTEEINTQLATKENISNKSVEINETANNTTYPSTQAVKEFVESSVSSGIADKESVENKDTVITSQSTNDTYPSSQAVFNAISAEISSNNVTVANNLSNGLATKENVDNKVVSVNSSSTDSQYPSAKAVHSAITSATNNVERTTNKVTSISNTSTDSQYPSAKAVNDLMLANIYLRREYYKVGYNNGATHFTTVYNKILLYCAKMMGYSNINSLNDGRMRTFPLTTAFITSVSKFSTTYVTCYYTASTKKWTIEFAGATTMLEEYSYVVKWVGSLTSSSSVNELPQGYNNNKQFSIGHFCVWC